MRKSRCCLTGSPHAAQRLALRALNSAGTLFISKAGIHGQEEAVAFKGKGNIDPPLAHTQKLEIHKAGGRAQSQTETVKSLMPALRLHHCLVREKQVCSEQIGLIFGAAALVINSRIKERGGPELLRMQHNVAQLVGRYDPLLVLRQICVDAGKILPLCVT